MYRWTVVYSYSKPGTLNTAFNELYLLMLSLDFNQFLPDRYVYKSYYWLKFGEDLSCASKIIAH